MSLNNSELNSTPVNAGAGRTVGSGAIVSLEQKVGVIGSGVLASLDQTVQHRSTGTGAITTLSQSVQEVFSGSIVDLDQTVRDLTDTTASHLVRTGWDLDVYVGGEALDKSKIIGIASINFSEGDSATASIVLRGDIGAQDLDYYDGKSVIIKAKTYSSSNNPTITTDSDTRIFTGIVDITEIDLINEFITLRCVNERRKLINDNLSSLVPTIGTWSETIFNGYADTAELLDQRIQTVQKSLDFDGYNNYMLTSWTPKATADFTFSGGAVFTKEPRLERASAARIINKVNINMQYRYDRWHHRQVSFQWTSPIDNNPCKILVDGYDLTRKDIVREAVKQAGWPLRGDITFTAPPAAGWYSCSGTYAALSYTNTTARLEARTDINGNTVTDSEGNTIYDPVTTNVTTYSDTFCAGASWNATTRWAQTVTEEQTITVTAPQSTSQYGTITKEVTYGLEAPINSATWENYTRYDTNQGSGNNYFVDQDYNEAEYRNAVKVAMAIAKTDILSSHRDTRVIFSIPFKPDINLSHTVETTATRISCKGKVQKYTHSFNHRTTEAFTTVEVVLSRASGSTSEQTLAVPARLNTGSAPSAPGVINLGNHFGEDPSQSGAEAWTGFIGNKVVQGVKTNYTQIFVVDVPAIENESRDNKTLSGSTSYNIEVPNHTLSVTFEGKSLA